MTPDILQNPVLLYVLGLVVKYVPGVRSVIQNSLIPTLLVLVAWIPSVIGALTGVANAGPLDGAPVVAAGIGGVLAGFGSALLAAAKAWAFQEMIGRRWLPSKPKDSI